MICEAWVRSGMEGRATAGIMVGRSDSLLVVAFLY